jgi:predicted  nucleic acid-binding Zn-ribbon protein
VDKDIKAKISMLQEAIRALNDAKRLIHEALGDTDSYQESMTQIDELIEDLDADLLYFNEAQPI